MLESVEILLKEESVISNRRNDAALSQSSPPRVLEKVMSAELKNFEAKLCMSRYVSAVTKKCLERDFLDQQELQAIIQSKEDINNVESAQILLGAVKNAIKRNPRAYDAFVAVLEETLTDDDDAKLVSEMKRELQVVRDREYIAECSEGHGRAEKSKPTFEATKVGTKEGANTSKSAEKGEPIANGGGAPRRPVQVHDRSNECCVYVWNPPPINQVKENFENAQVVTQSVRGMQNTRELQGLVEELQCQLDAMRVHLSGAESLKHSISSEYAALQERTATMKAEYESRIEAEIDEKNQLIEKLKNEELKSEQKNSDNERLMAEVKQLRQQNKYLHEKMCDHK